MPQGVIVVLENGSGVGSGMGISIEELARIDEALRRRGHRARAVRLLPRRGAPVGRRLRDRRRGGGRCGGGRVRRPDRARAARAGPPQRLALGARVALGPPRAPGRGTDRSPRARPAPHAPGPRRRRRSSSRRPGMDEGYDIVNMGRARDLVAGRPLPTLPPAAFETRSAKGRSAPPEPDADASTGRALVTRWTRVPGNRRSGRAVRRARRRCCSRSSPSPRSCACPASTSGAPGTPTRAPTCSSCRASSIAARSRCSARRRRSAPSTTAPSTTTCSRRRRSSPGRIPVAVTGEIALFGLGAVAATWWLARLLGGPRRRARRGAAHGRVARPASRPRPSSGTRT